MSYAIVRNEKLTRAEVNGKGTHNDRKAKNHTNKDIDTTKTHLNYYIKKNELTYTKEFDKYLKEIEKIKTRELTTFYFNDRKNQDIQEYDGHQYNELYQFGGKVVEYNEEKSIMEVRNRLQVGDTLEILVPNQLEAVQFKIDKLWDFETNEEKDVVNPGVKDQKVKMMLPVKCEENWIIRRKK